MTASEIMGAAEACSNLAKQYASVLRIAAVLKEIGNIELHKAHLESAIAPLQETKAELDRIKAEIAAATERRDRLVSEAEAAEARQQKIEAEIRTVMERLGA